MAKAAKARVKSKRKAAKGKTVLVLRTADKDRRSYGGFQWPIRGRVRCRDWDAHPVCGAGLHGLLWGEGDGELLDWSEDAVWQVVEVQEREIVSLVSKVKFPRGKVVHTGDRLSATSFLLANGGDGKSVVGAIVQAGNGGTATAGYKGTAMAGLGGIVMAGHRGILSLRWFDAKSNRYRLAIAYVGENGILPDTPYRLNDKHKFTEVKQAP